MHFDCAIGLLSHLHAKQMNIIILNFCAGLHVILLHQVMDGYIVIMHVLTEATMRT